MNMKFANEIFNSFEDLCKFVKNGRIIFDKSGRIEFFKSDYALQRDADVVHNDFGYTAEKDAYLKHNNIPIKKTLKKGTIVQLEYGEYYETIVYKINSNPKNTFSHDAYVSNERSKHNKKYEEIRKINFEKLFPKEHPEFNCNWFFLCLDKKWKN